MLKLARMGVVIAPPVPAFYNHPQSLQDVVDYTVMRLLDPFGIRLEALPRWQGRMLVGGQAEPAPGKNAAAVTPIRSLPRRRK